MTDVTQILSNLEAGDQKAAAELLPVVYDELRKLAAAKMLQERPDHTLQATALVHEAYVRLVDSEQSWESKTHFFAAAANSMRQILVNWAHSKKAGKRGGNAIRVDMEDLADKSIWSPEVVLDLDQKLTEFAKVDTVAAELVKLRILAGLSVTEAGRMLNLSRTDAYDNWKFARAWFAAREQSALKE